jgi:hypothetical protein
VGATAVALDADLPIDASSLQWLVRPGPIEIPSPLERRHDIPRIIEECMLDAVSELAWASPLVRLA